MVGAMANPSVLASGLQSFSHLPVTSSILVHEKRFVLLGILPLSKFFLDDFDQH